MWISCHKSKHFLMIFVCWTEGYPRKQRYNEIICLVLLGICDYIQESLNSDDLQFHQYQQLFSYRGQFFPLHIIIDHKLDLNLSN
jgi:hypothetical protein